MVLWVYLHNCCFCWVWAHAFFNPIRIQEGDKKEKEIQGGFGNFRQDHGVEAFLFNPFRRRELMMLPPTRVSKLDNWLSCTFRWNNGHSFGLGFDCITGTFKLVHVSNERKVVSMEPYSLDFILTAEVHELGTNSWRQIAVDLDPSIEFQGDVVSAYGDLHWLACNNDRSGLSRESMIASFDSKQETFRLTPHPHPHHPIKEYFCLFEHKEVLVVTDWSSFSHIDVWFMKDYEKKEWAKEFRLRMQDFITRFLSMAQWVCRAPWECDQRSLLVVGAREDGLVFLTDRGQLQFYDRSGYLRILDLSVGGQLFLKFSCRSMLSLKSYGNLVARDGVDEEYAYDLAA